MQSRTCAPQVAARKRFTITLEVTSKDQSYPWVLSWLHAQSAHSLSTMQQHVRCGRLTVQLCTATDSPTGGGLQRRDVLAQARQRIAAHLI
jgi:hypothetical protein